MHRKEGQLEAEEDHPEADLAKRLAHHSAGHFREPVSRSAEQRKHRAADQHIMEVGDDEIGVMELEDRAEPTATITPVSPPMTKVTMNPTTYSIGVWKRGRPVPHRREPAEYLQPRRDRDRHAGGGVEAVAEPRQAGREHVMDPQAEGEDPVEIRPAPRPDSRTPGGGRMSRRCADEARRGQEDDVDFGVAEEPEQMLPQQRVAISQGCRIACRPAGPKSACSTPEHRRHGEDDHEPT